MNFLAHLFLSCEREELLIGNFLGDFVKNREILQFDPGVQEGVYLHRKIDVFTDQHPLVLQGVRRLYAKHSKYAPVLIDVFYDYFLSKNWDNYASKPLRLFVNSIYETLIQYQHQIPDRLKKRVTAMIADDWLLNYSTMEGMHQTFYWMKKRVSKPQFFENVVESLQKDEQLLDAEFNQFFPDVMDFVNNECFC